MENDKSKIKKRAFSFVAAQIQFIQASDTIFAGITPPEEGKKLFNNLLAKQEGFIIKAKRPKGKNISIYFDPICELNKVLLGAKIGKSRRMMLPYLENEHLTEREILAYPFVLMLWDNDNQVILMQQKTDVFSDSVLPIEAIMYYLNSELLLKGLIAKWNLIKEKGTFWDTYDKFESIESLEIELTAPNFLGSAIKKANDFVKTLKAETNGTEFSFGINNESGKVNLNKSDGLVSSMAEMVDAGGGNFIVKGLKKGKKAKREKINLKRQYKIIRADKKYNDIEFLNPERIFEITNTIKDQYNIKGIIDESDKNSNN